MQQRQTPPRANFFQSVPVLGGGFFPVARLHLPRPFQRRSRRVEVALLASRAVFLTELGATGTRISAASRSTSRWLWQTGKSLASRPFLLFLSLVNARAPPSPNPLPPSPSICGRPLSRTVDLTISRFMGRGPVQMWQDKFRHLRRHDETKTQEPTHTRKHLPSSSGTDSEAMMSSAWSVGSRTSRQRERVAESQGEPCGWHV